ncbi:M15 family metallopeptidase [Lentibacillus sediminis]|uniref:M15 family metallopeptidase n=1 Tax=Lentibacillus sediminis TaxID=1940529 RepID=UPI000C1BBEA7|nr:M15 family metallopeptidase [Lentibacillus sediminis]
MKKVIDILLPWALIAFFLMILLLLYNQMNGNYVDRGEDAPVPEHLHPVVEENKNILLEQAADIGIDVVITDGTRSIERQNELYAQGRTADGVIVTHAEGGESYHNYGLAIDYALRNDEGEIIWDITYDGNDNGERDWFEVADIAKELGFEWGGDWESFTDYPHLQMDFGLSIAQLQRGLRPDPEGEQEEAHE